jgi:hypothetical protein
MGLLTNGYRDVIGVFRIYGGTFHNSSFPQGTLGNYNLTGMKRNLTAGEGITNDLVGIPSGYRNPGAWMMPQKPGALSSRSRIVGSGTVSSASAQAARELIATLNVGGSGGVTSAPLGLIISLLATITGSGGVSSATASALTSLVATLTGSGGVSSAAIQGLAALAASLSGSGSINANNTALMDLTATIRGYGDLTPEGLRDAVWNAALDGTVSAAEIMRLLAAVAGGKTTIVDLGGGLATVTFRDLNDTTDRVVADMTDSERTSVTRDLD